MPRPAGPRRTARSARPEPQCGWTRRYVQRHIKRWCAPVIGGLLVRLASAGGQRLADGDAHLLAQFISGREETGEQLLAQLCAQRANVRPVIPLARPPVRLPWRPWRVLVQQENQTRDPPSLGLPLFQLGDRAPVRIVLLGDIAVAVREIADVEAAGGDVGQAPVERTLVGGYLFLHRDHVVATAGGVPGRPSHGTRASRCTWKRHRSGPLPPPDASHRGPAARPDNDHQAAWHALLHFRIPALPGRSDVQGLPYALLHGSPRCLFSSFSGRQAQSAGHCKLPGKPGGVPPPPPEPSWAPQHRNCPRRRGALASLFADRIYG